MCAESLSAVHHYLYVLCRRVCSVHAPVLFYDVWGVHGHWAGRVVYAAVSMLLSVSLYVSI